MKKFLAQFKTSLTPMQMVWFEQFIFQMADRMIPGYRGGTWESKTIGKSVILVIPTDAKTVGISVPNGESVETDALTASVAFTSLVTNWFWHNHDDDMADNQAFGDFHENLRNDVYTDQQKFKIDQRAYFKLTD